MTLDFSSYEKLMTSLQMVFERSHPVLGNNCDLFCHNIVS